MTNVGQDDGEAPPAYVEQEQQYVQQPPQYVSQQPNPMQPNNPFYGNQNQGQQPQQMMYGQQQPPVYQQPMQQNNQMPMQQNNPFYGDQIAAQQQGMPIQSQQQQQPQYIPSQQQNINTPMQYNNDMNTPVEDTGLQEQTNVDVIDSSGNGNYASSNGFGETEYGKRLDYNGPVYRDKIMAIIWIVHMVIMLVLTITTRTGNNFFGAKIAAGGFGILFICCVVGALIGYGWIFVLNRWSATIIKIMLFANLFFLVFGAIMNFALGLILSGVFTAIIAILFAIYIWAVWSRIPFAEAMIEICTTIVQMYKTVIWLTLACVGLQLIWIILFSMIATAYMYRLNANGFVVFLLCISFFWNLETFKNICHTSICGVAATWYFTDYINDTSSPNTLTPVKDSFKRSVTTSLGSIAFGSLIVAFIQALRAILRNARNEFNAIIICIIDCILACLQRWAEWFNSYAFAHVSIYGTDFINSAKNTWALLSSKGMMAIINDSLVDFAILCGSLVSGFICAILALGIAANGLFLSFYAGAFSFLGFLIGFFMCQTVLSVISSMVVSIFVCYSEDPNAMEQLHKDEYYKLSAAIDGVSRNDDNNDNNNDDINYQRMQV